VKSQGKTKIFQGQETAGEFCKKSGKILVLVKVSEKSGNFVGFVGQVKCHTFKILWKTERDQKCRKDYWWSAKEVEATFKGRFGLFDNSHNARSVKIVFTTLIERSE